MIFLTAGEIFQTVFILNGNDDSALLRQVLLQNLQEILIRRLTAYVGLPILEDPDQTDIIIIGRQIRLHIRKIAHMDRHILTVTVAVGIDQAALLREIHAGHPACFFRQCSRNGSAAAADLQHLIRFFHRKEIHDIFPQGRQMI